jgi:hypothetical protein
VLLELERTPRAGAPLEACLAAVVAEGVARGDGASPRAEFLTGSRVLDERAALTAAGQCRAQHSDPVRPHLAGAATIVVVRAMGDEAPVADFALLRLSPRGQIVMVPSPWGRRTVDETSRPRYEPAGDRIRSCPDTAL